MTIGLEDNIMGQLMIINIEVITNYSINLLQFFSFQILSEYSYGKYFKYLGSIDQIFYEHAFFIFVKNYFKGLLLSLYAYLNNSVTIGKCLNFDLDSSTF